MFCITTSLQEEEEDHETLKTKKAPLQEGPNLKLASYEPALTLRVQHKRLHLKVLKGGL